MDQWIPLLQSLVWPAFLAIFLFLARKQVLAVLKSISNRIQRGDPFQAGPSGISFGLPEQPKLTRLEETPEASSKTAKTAANISTLGVDAPSNTADGIARDDPAQYKRVTYLVHHVTPPRRDTDGVERRGITIMIDVDSEDILDKIERVVYHLHPTFPQPDREVKDRKVRFALSTRAWGEFNLSADVYFKGYTNPLTLFRYLNFYTS